MHFVALQQPTIYMAKQEAQMSQMDSATTVEILLTAAQLYEKLHLKTVAAIGNNVLNEG